MVMIYCSLCCYFLLFQRYGDHRDLRLLTHSSPPRRYSELQDRRAVGVRGTCQPLCRPPAVTGSAVQMTAVTTEVTIGTPVPTPMPTPTGTATWPSEKRPEARPMRPPARLRTVMILPPEPSRRSEEHTSELQSLMRISFAVFCLKKK